MRSVVPVLKEPNWWQRVVQRFASTRLGAAFFALTLHHLDRVVLRLSGGRQTLTALLAGVPILWLTTIGAKSKLPRTLPLVALPDGDKVVLIASNFGQRHHPAWYHNLLAQPEAQLARGGVSQTFVAHEVSGAERERYWRQAVALYPGYAAYARRTGGRVIPVLVLVPKVNTSLR